MTKWKVPFIGAIVVVVAGIGIYAFNNYPPKDEDVRGTIGNSHAINAAAYFPRLRMPDPLSENRLAEFAPCCLLVKIDYKY